MRRIFLLLIVFTLFITWGCVYTSTEKVPPKEINLLYPPKDNFKVETNLTLFWNIPSGREFQPENFKVFISDSRNDVLNMTTDYYMISTNDSNACLDYVSNTCLMKVPFRLKKDTEYYWRVVAYDESYGSFPGPVWRFKTNNLKINLSKVLPYDYPNSIISDSNGFVIGTSQGYGSAVDVEKLDYSGNIIWKISEDSWTVKLKRLPDGGYAACFGQKLAKISESGSILKERNISGDCESLAIENSNLYVAYREISGTIRIDVFDKNFDKIETHVMPSDVNNIIKFFVDSDDTFVILGNGLNPEGEQRSYVIKVDDTGGVVWGFSNDEVKIITDMINVEDGYILVGTQGNNMIIAKLLKSGSEAWKKVYSRFSDSSDSDFKPLSSILIPMSVASIGKDIIVAGFSVDRNEGDVYSYFMSYPPVLDKDFDAFVAKLNEDGNIISLEKFGGSKGDAGIFLQAVGDSRVIVAGITKSNDGDVSSDIDESEFPNGAVWVFGIDINE